MRCCVVILLYCYKRTTYSRPQRHSTMLTPIESGSGLNTSVTPVWYNHENKLFPFPIYRVSSWTREVAKPWQALSFLNELIALWKSALSCLRNAAELCLFSKTRLRLTCFFRFSVSQPVSFLLSVPQILVRFRRMVLGNTLDVHGYKFPSLSTRISFLCGITWTCYSA